MKRTRIKLAVYVDLDPIPGTFHSADSARNVVGNMLIQSIPHYKPIVSIESYDTEKNPSNYHYDENLLIQARDLMTPDYHGRKMSVGIINLIANAYEITYEAALEKIMNTSTPDHPIDNPRCATCGLETKYCPHGKDD